MNHQSAEMKQTQSSLSGEVTASRTERPVFLGDPTNDALWDLVTALTNELGATRARLDALERVLAEQNTIDDKAVDRWVPNETDAVERTHDYQAYISRVYNTLTL